MNPTLKNSVEDAMNHFNTEAQTAQTNEKNRKKNAITRRVSSGAAFVAGTAFGLYMVATCVKQIVKDEFNKDNQN